MRLQTQEWEKAGDRRFIFLACYADMTESMHAALGKGQFRDDAWVSGLLTTFSAYYFRALEAYESSTGFVPAAWRCAFDLARSPHTSVEEDLILGVNAHINADLPFAVRDLLAAGGSNLTDEQLAERYADYSMVNEIITGTTWRVQTEIVDRYDPVTAMVDRISPSAMRAVDWAIDRVLSVWREEVWSAGVRLWRGAPDDFDRMSADVHHIAMRRVHVITYEAEQRARLLELAGHELHELYADLRHVWMRGLPHVALPAR